MSQLIFGEVLDENFGVIEFPLPENAVLVWRESPEAQAVLCETEKDIPGTWKLDRRNSWKIFGNYDLIKRTFPGFDIPPGSKVIGLKPGAVININFGEKNIRFKGTRQKRILIVDDSSTMRKVLRKVFSGYENWEVIGELDSAKPLKETIEASWPDLITLDLNMEGINGVEAMKQIISHKKIPTILVTSQSKEDGTLVMEALDAGAVDYLQKPEAGAWDAMKEDILMKIDGALKSKWQTRDASRKTGKISLAGLTVDPDKYLIVIGSSTGGTQALQEIFTSLPANIPPILVTQHIPKGFSKALAERLDKLCPFDIKEAEAGDEIRAGRVLIAPGDHHLKLTTDGRKVEILNTEPVNRFRPSIETMFQSALVSKRKIIAVMLTGMGKDGAQAMLALRKAGALTIAQDEKTSVVFGMPKEAIRLGAAENVKPLYEIAETLVELYSMNPKRSKKIS